MTQMEEKIQVEETSKITADSANNGNALTKPEASPSPSPPFGLTVEEKLVNQVEFYFGDVNLPRDKFIKTESAKHDGWFPAELLLKFNKLTSYIPEVPEDKKVSKIIEALQRSVLVEVNEDKSKIRRNPDMPIPEGNSDGKSIYLNLNKTETKTETLLAKQKRAERFSGGATADKESVTVDSVDAKAKADKRKERFGVPEKELITEKKTKRAERFGIGEKDPVEAKKSVRAQRFSSSDEKLAMEAKKLKRAERFSGGTTTEDKETVDAKKSKRSERFGAN